jgi:hypothetical protein
VDRGGAQACDEPGDRREDGHPGQRLDDRQPLRVRVAGEPDRRPDDHDPERGQDPHVEAAGPHELEHREEDNAARATA